MVVMISLKVICKCDGNFSILHLFLKYKAHRCNFGSRDVSDFNRRSSGRSRWVSGVSTEILFQILKRSFYSLYLMFMDSATKTI